MSATTIKNQITKSENRIADLAQNLSNWFGEERDTTLNSIPDMPFESLYVKSMLDKMTGEYRQLKSLTAKLTEFETKTNEETF